MNLTGEWPRGCRWSVLDCLHIRLTRRRAHSGLQGFHVWCFWLVCIAALELQTRAESVWPQAPKVRARIWVQKMIRSSPQPKYQKKRRFFYLWSLFGLVGHLYYTLFRMESHLQSRFCKVTCDCVFVLRLLCRESVLAAALHAKPPLWLRIAAIFDCHGGGGRGLGWKISSSYPCVLIGIAPRLPKRTLSSGGSGAQCPEESHIGATKSVSLTTTSPFIEGPHPTIGWLAGHVISLQLHGPLAGLLQQMQHPCLRHYGRCHRDPWRLQHLDSDQLWSRHLPCACPRSACWLLLLSISFGNRMLL